MATNSSLSSIMNPQLNTATSTVEVSNALMPKYGFGIGIVLSLIYTAIGGFLLNENYKNSKSGKTLTKLEMFGPLAFFIIPLINLYVFFAKDVNNQKDKESRNSIIGWTAVGPIVAIIVIGSILLSTR